MPSSSSLIVMATNLKDKHIFRLAAMLLKTSTMCLTNRIISFEHAI
jgi:hypothetical protein